MKEKDLEKKEIIYEKGDPEKDPKMIEEARLANYQAEQIYSYDDYLNWAED